MSTISERQQRVMEAFTQDQFTTLERVETYQDGLGICVSSAAPIGDSPAKRKKAYYIDGDPHTLGYLMGRLAEPEIARMCDEFVENIVFAFLKIPNLDLFKLMKALLENISQHGIADLPLELRQEVQGMLEGCRSVNPDTEVDLDSLWALNVGIDVLLSSLYCGKLPLPFQADASKVRALARGHKDQLFHIPIACNGFVISGVRPETQAPYHYMGRDFMFPTADVFQDTAAVIIRKPAQGCATVSVAAPGMIGSIAGVNENGVGVGVDILPAANADADRPGFNSLPLARWSIEAGGDYEAALEVMVQAQRGVPWIYLLADGSTGLSGIVEAGKKTAGPDFWAYVEPWAKKVLLAVNPHFTDLLQTPSTLFRDGLMARRADYQYPRVYQDSDFNRELIKEYNRRALWTYHYGYDPADFGETGYLNHAPHDGGKPWTIAHCPGPFYFAPPRRPLPSGVMVTNHAIIPEMRLYGMSTQIENLVGGTFDDIQWRYDQLHAELLTRLQPGSLSKDDARAAIDFLAPSGSFPKYYNKGGEADLRKVQVHGAVALIDLKEKSLQAHYGYYADEWVNLCLPNYL